MPQLRGCCGKARIQGVLIRHASLTGWTNSPWRFGALNSHHRNVLVFPWGLNLSGRDAQCRGGDGEGFCREQKVSLALEDLFATQGLTLPDFCRD